MCSSRRQRPACRESRRSGRQGSDRQIDRPPKVRPAKVAESRKRRRQPMRRTGRMRRRQRQEARTRRRASRIVALPGRFAAQQRARELRDPPTIHSEGRALPCEPTPTSENGDSQSPPVQPQIGRFRNNGVQNSLEALKSRPKGVNFASPSVPQQMEGSPCRVRVIRLRRLSWQQWRETSRPGKARVASVFPSMWTSPC